MDDILETPGSRGCRVWVNLSYHVPWCLSSGNLSNEKVFSRPNSIFSMQPDFSHGCRKDRKHWLLPCREHFQSLWENQEITAAVGAGFLPGDGHSWRISAPWTGMKCVWWTGVRGSWKKPWWRENWWSFYKYREENRGQLQGANNPGPSASVLDNERHHPTIPS